MQRMLRATAAPWVPAPAPAPAAPALAAVHVPAAIPVPATIDEANFLTMLTAGRVTATYVKWWSSPPNWPNHNIEMMVNVDGTAWAVVHIKWKDRTGPTDRNVQMATFKARDGTSIPNGNIWGIEGASRFLLTEALRYANLAPMP